MNLWAVHSEAGQIYTAIALELIWYSSHSQQKMGQDAYSEPKSMTGC